MYIAFLATQIVRRTLSEFAISTAACSTMVKVPFIEVNSRISMTIVAVEVNIPLVTACIETRRMRLTQGQYKLWTCQQEPLAFEFGYTMSGCSAVSTPYRRRLSSPLLSITQPPPFVASRQ